MRKRQFRVWKYRLHSLDQVAQACSGLVRLEAIWVQVSGVEGRGDSCASTVHTGEKPFPYDVRGKGCVAHSVLSV